MAHEFNITRRVEFSETDAAGIVHFANYFRYMEHAEHAFFRSLGRSIVDSELDVGWPRVHCHCDFKKPLKFEDQVEIQLLVEAITSKSIRYQFRFCANGTEVGRGGFTIVCVRRNEAGEMKAANIPPEIASLIEAAPEDKLIINV
ncbi:MAG: acyl-CoA thioesterase [Verrucomicrobia subdivision 3 bacterium]|nr:acyl-CoA thioesterase [Limisphaerales bacterium]